MVPRNQRVAPKKNLKDNVPMTGSDAVRLEFKFEDGEFVLRTAYPQKGSAVWSYRFINRYERGWVVEG